MPAKAKVEKGQVNMVVAMPAEARPLVEAFALEPVAGCDPFQVYHGDRVSLIVSGPGMARAAAAAGYLYRLNGGCREQGWLNVGVGGHRAHPTGAAFLAHRVSDGLSLESWYPPRVFTAPCPGEAVLTVGRVEREYPRPVIYEMEAAGFMAAALRFATAELVQVLKIISDNADFPASRVRSRDIGAFVAGQQCAIESVLTSLGELAGEMRALERPHPEQERFLEQWRFTATQQHQLRELLRRFGLLLPGRSAFESARGQERARGVLQQLALELDAVVPDLKA